MNTLRYAITVILGIALPLAAQRWDRRRLSPERRAGAWSFASWGAALYAFGPLSMLGWLWVTRSDFSRWQRRDGTWVALIRSGGLLLVGVVAAALLFAVIVGVDALIGVLAGDPD